MAPAARTAPPLPAGPAPGVFGPRRLTPRLAHTPYTLHTASSHTRQPHGHHELKIFSRFLAWVGLGLALAALLAGAVPVIRLRARAAGIGMRRPVEPPV